MLWVGCVTREDTFFLHLLWALVVCRGGLNWTFPFGPAHLPDKTHPKRVQQGVGAHGSWASVFVVLLCVMVVLSCAGWTTSGVLCIKLKRAMRSLERAERRNGDDDRVEFQRLPMHEDGHPHDMFRPDT